MSWPATSLSSSSTISRPTQHAVANTSNERGFAKPHRDSRQDPRTLVDVFFGARFTGRQCDQRPEHRCQDLGRSGLQSWHDRSHVRRAFSVTIFLHKRGDKNTINILKLLTF